jgi:hypothetical protein
MNSAVIEDDMFNIIIGEDEFITDEVINGEFTGYMVMFKGESIPMNMGEMINKVAISEMFSIKDDRGGIIDKIVIRMKFKLVNKMVEVGMGGHDNDI